MSEFRPRVSALLTIGTIGLASLVMEACDSGGNDPNRPPAVERCYDTPQASEYQKPPNRVSPTYPVQKPNESNRHYNAALKQYEIAEKRWRQSQNTGDLPTVTLRYSQDAPYLAGDPTYNQESYLEGKIDQTAKGIVRISDENGSGSGFLMTDAKGKQVVVTAAHVIGNTALDNLTIRDDDGESSHPTGGCYIYEDKGHFSKLTADNKTVVDTDIAVLTLAKPLSRYPLKLSQRPIKRGDWTYFANYQGTYEPGYPATYTGVVATTPNDQAGYDVLTGLTIKNTPVTNGEVDDNNIQSGASGGPILDATSGAVVGMATSGQKDGIFEDVGTLRAVNGIAFTGRQKLDFDHGFAPNTAGAMSIRLIQRAVNAPQA